MSARADILPRGPCKTWRREPAAVASKSSPPKPPPPRYARSPSPAFAGEEVRSGWDVRQPDRILADEVGRHKAQRRPGGGEIGLAATEGERAEVETVFVDETKVGQGPCEFRAGDVDLASDLRL